MRFEEFITGAKPLQTSQQFSEMERAIMEGGGSLDDTMSSTGKISALRKVVAEGSLKEFAPAGGTGGNNYGGDLHDILMTYISANEPGLLKHFGQDVVDSTVSDMVVMGTFGDIDPSDEDDLEDALVQIIEVLNDGLPDQQGVAENFADGKVKGKSRPGRVKRAGASCDGSVTDLRAKAKNASGERAKMYHWCANMKGGRK